MRFGNMSTFSLDTNFKNIARCSSRSYGCYDFPTSVGECKWIPNTLFTSSKCPAFKNNFAPLPISSAGWKIILIFPLNSLSFNIFCCPKQCCCIPRHARKHDLCLLLGCITSLCFIYQRKHPYPLLTISSFLLPSYHLMLPKFQSPPTLT